MFCIASVTNNNATRTTPSLSDRYVVSGLACRSIFSPLIVALCITVTQAKAWVLAVLGTVVAYDLTQTSEDPWSLRVYRGELWFSKHERERAD